MGEVEMLALVESCYPVAVARALAVADESPDPVQAGIETAIAMAEMDPAGARTVLFRLLADWSTLERLEQYVGGEATKATLRVGAAIQFARAELASPQLRRRLPELLEWLGEAGPNGRREPARLSGSGKSPELVAEEVERHRHRDGDRLRRQVAEAGAGDEGLEHG